MKAKDVVVLVGAGSTGDPHSRQVKYFRALGNMLCKTRPDSGRVLPAFGYCKRSIAISLIDSGNRQSAVTHNRERTAG